MELQLASMEGPPVNAPTVAYTLAVGLRRALCEHIGIEEREIGIAANETRNHNGHSVQSIYLFDTASGGAGYSSQVPHHLPRLLKQVAESVLQCPNECDAAFQACVLTYETQHQIDNLNRHEVLELLTPQFLAAVALPETHRAFGEHTRLELEPLVLAIQRETLRLHPDQIRLYLGGDPDQWEPLAWRFLSELRRMAESGLTITLLVDSGVLPKLSQGQKDALAAVVSQLGATLQEGALSSRSLEGEGMVPMVEIGGEARSGYWAASATAALAPDDAWGSGAAELSYVFSGMQDKPLTGLQGWSDVSIDSLRPQASQRVAEIRITQGLDGPADRFGFRFWHLVRRKIPALADRLSGNLPIQALSYSDRYLNSPISVLLLERIISQLLDFPGGLSESSEIAINTAELGSSHGSWPRFWSHDWQSEHEREQVMTRVFAKRPFSLALDIQPKHHTPHERFLRLDWGQGAQWEIRLDQGVGYWTPSGKGNYFPFEQNEAGQAETIRKGLVTVSARAPSNSTILYIVDESAG